jgi:hypothetical protein
MREEGSLAPSELIGKHPAPPHASRHGKQLSWGYVPFRSIGERGAITRIGYVNPLHPSRDHAVFTPRSAESFHSQHHPPVGLQSPTEHHRGCPLEPQAVQGRSHGVQPPTAQTAHGSYLPGFASPGTCASRVSHPPSALLRRGLPGLFRPGSAHGVQPSRAYTLHQAGNSLSGTRCPHAVSQTTRRWKGPTSGPYARHRAVSARAGLRRSAERALVGLHPFRAFSSPVQSPRKEGIRSWAYMRSAHSPDPQRPTACFHAGESA